LSLLGVNIADYVTEIGYLPGSFTYDKTNFIASWTLRQSIEADKLRIILDGDPSGVTDLSGNLLDGEWVDGTSNFPSGNGTAGGDFLFRLNVLPCDGNQSEKTDILDAFQLRGKLQTAYSDPIYSRFFDFNGDGNINIFDAFQLREYLQTTLPEGEPLLPLESGAVSSMLALGIAAESASPAYNIEPTSKTGACMTLRAQESASPTVEYVIPTLKALPSISIFPPMRYDLVSFDPATNYALADAGLITTPASSRSDSSLSARWDRNSANTTVQLDTDGYSRRFLLNKSTDDVAAIHRSALDVISKELQWHFHLRRERSDVCDSETLANLFDDMHKQEEFANLRWRKSVDEVLKDSYWLF